MDDPITPAPTPAPELPPAAVIVTKSPRELALEKELEETQKKQRDAEMLAAEKEDELQQIKELDSRRPAPPAKKKRKVPGLTFFHEETEEED